MGNDVAAFAFGLFAGFFVFVCVARFTQPNISAEELYRFCIVRKIELKDCKVPPLNLPKEATND